MQYLVPSPRAEFFKIPFDCDGGCDVGMRRSALILSGKLGRRRSKLGTTLLYLVLIVMEAVTSGRFLLILSY